jgi:hypothetical protein
LLKKWGIVEKGKSDLWNWEKKEPNSTFGSF